MQRLKGKDSGNSALFCLWGGGERERWDEYGIVGWRGDMVRPCLMMERGWAHFLKKKDISDLMKWKESS